MRVGAPTKYDPHKTPLAVDAYLLTTGKEQMTLPTREGFSHYIGVDSDTVVEWDKRYPEFSVTLKKIDELQKQQLMNDGMYGGKEVNAGMAIFLLKVNHGMIETSHTDITSNGKEIAPMVEINTTR